MVQLSFLRLSDQVLAQCNLKVVPQVLFVSCSVKCPSVLFPTLPDMDHDNIPSRRVGRPPKYDWSDKKELCYRLYVEEKKSGAEIAQYFAERLNVAPEDLPW